MKTTVGSAKALKPVLPIFTWGGVILCWLFPTWAGAEPLSLTITLDPPC